MPQTHHRRSIDLARFAAAFGIVWAHAHAPGQIMGYLALSLFLVLTGFLSVKSLERSRGRFSWLARAQRIAFPWLFWSLFFRVLNVMIADEPLPLLSEPFSLLIGSALHLWFLPFVMIVSPLVPLLTHLIRTPRALALGCLVLVLIGPPMLWAQNFVTMPEPFPQWGFAFPPFLYGVLAAIGHRMGQVWLPLAAAAATVAVTLLMTAATPASTGAWFWAVQVLLAGLVFEALWRIDLRGEAVAALGRLAFGIYLVHPFFLAVGYKFFAGQGTVFLALFTFAGSAVATFVLQRLPGLRRMV